MGAELAGLATSLRRIEATIADISRMQASTTEAIDRMATSMDTVVDKVTAGIVTVTDQVVTGMDTVGRMAVEVAENMETALSSRRGSEKGPEPAEEDPEANRTKSLQSSGWQADDHVAPTPPRSSDYKRSVGLPVGWPSCVAERKDLVAKYRGPARSIQYYQSMVFESASTNHFATRVCLEDDIPRTRSACHRIIIHPNANLHMVFSLCSTLILIYDLIVVPFMLAWEVPLAGFPMVIATGVACFWTLDVLVNFLSGYQIGGHVVMAPCLIARHYMLTWFIPDVAVLASDWLSLVFVLASKSDDTSTESLRILRFTKLSRLLRVIAIVRMVKFAVVLERHIEKRLSDTYRLMLKIVCVLCGTLWLSHILACVFFVLGRRAPSNTGAHWVDDMQSIGDHSIVFLEEDIAYQYITSFHWCVSHITLGSMGIEVSNTNERVFSIFMLLLGLLFGGTMISSLSATMIDFQMLAKDKKDKLRTLRRYLRENHVDHRVAVLVHQQAAERLWKNARLVGQDVQALNLISVSLRTELHFELCRRHVIRHPLFRLWSDMDVSMAGHFCSECVNFMFPMPLDDIFLPGTAANACYFVIVGSLSYTQKPGSSPVKEPKETPIGSDQWLCEAALWSQWIHVGTLRAEAECQLLVVCVDRLESVLQRNRMLRSITLEYCKQYHHRIKAAKPPEAPWPNDISVPFTEFGAIVASMDQSVQATVSLGALDRLAASRSWHRGFEKLGEEVRAGKSVLTIDGDGNIERIVAIVVVHIKDRNGFILSRIAKKKDTDLMCSCLLPGKKQQYAEVVGETANRILEDLHLHAPDIEILATERIVEWGESRQVGVRTKYLRTVCHVKLHSEFQGVGMEMRRLPVRMSSKGSAIVDSGPMKVPKSDIYVLYDGRKAFYYAWLTKAEFEQLQTTAGEAVLADWIARVIPVRYASSDLGERPSGDKQNNDEEAPSEAQALSQAISDEELARKRGARVARVGSDAPSEGKAIGDKAIADRTICDKVIVDEAIVDKVIVDEAIVDQVIVDEAIADEEGGSRCDEEDSDSRVPGTSTMWL